MGWLRKTIKKIGKGIKKVGKKIGKAFKKVLKPFAKIFNKLGPLGTIALSMFLPGIGTALAGWGAGMGNVLGTMIKFVGNAINYVATAPQKIFGTITDALGASWNTLTGATSGTWKPGSWFDNFSKQMNDRIAGDGWFGGKSGSWASFDTTANLPISDGSVMFNEATNTWQDSVSGKNLKLDSAGKPISLDVGQQVYEYKGPFSKAASTEPKLVSDGTVDFTGDVGEGTYVDSITRKPLKLDSSGKPISLKKGATWSGQTESFLGRGRDKLGAFREKHDDKFWAASLGTNAYQAYNQFAPRDDDPFGVGGGYTYAWDALSKAEDTSQGLFNTQSPTWDYNYSTSLMANQQSAANTWNSNYGFSQEFNPFATPGYGWGYEQWLQSMGFAPVR